MECGNRGAYTAVDAASVPADANIIGSNFVYRRKLDGSTKARIVPWGHRGKDKDFLRGGAQSVNFEVFRLIQYSCPNEVGSRDKWTSKLHSYSHWVSLASSTSVPHVKLELRESFGYYALPPTL